MADTRKTDYVCDDEYLGDCEGEVLPAFGNVGYCKKHDALADWEPVRLRVQEDGSWLIRPAIGPSDG